MYTNRSKGWWITAGLLFLAAGTVTIATRVALACGGGDPPEPYFYDSTTQDNENVDGETFYVPYEEGKNRGYYFGLVQSQYGICVTQGQDKDIRYDHGVPSDRTDTVNLSWPDADTNVTAPGSFTYRAKWDDAAQVPQGESGDRDDGYVEKSITIVAYGITWNSAPAIGCSSTDLLDNADEIMSPPSNAIYLPGQKVEFTCNRAVDLDRKTVNSVPPAVSYVTDALDSVNFPLWSCTAGAFVDYDNIGTSVEWIAPNAEVSNIKVELREEDLPSSVPSWHTGSRDDGVRIVDFRWINTSIPVISHLTVSDNETLYYSSTTHQEWLKGGEIDSTIWDNRPTPVRRDPALYIRNNNIACELSFTNPIGEIEYSEAAHVNFKGFSTTPGDFSTITKDIAGLPAGSGTHYSLSPLWNDISKRLVSVDWKYRVPNGSNVWIPMGTTSFYVYTVFAHPLEDPTIKRCDVLVGGACSGLTTAGAASKAIQNYISPLSPPPYFDGSERRTDHFWEMMETTAPPHENRGDCFAMASLMACMNKMLGIQATPIKVYATSDASPFSLETRGCASHGTEELYYVDAGDYVNNWEGTCEVYADSTYYHYGGGTLCDGSDSDRGISAINMMRELMGNGYGDPCYQMWFDNEYLDLEDHYQPLPNP